MFRFRKKEEQAAAARCLVARNLGHQVAQLLP